MEEMLAVALRVRAAEEERRDDLVGVDVDPENRGRNAGDAAEGFHQMLRGSAIEPAIADAATVAGLARCVRVFGPCRPSKLRFVVLTTRLSAKRSSPMWPQNPHADSCHSKPASLNTRSRPSASAASFTPVLPGTHTACTPAFTLRPFNTSAAARRSERRAFVHEPM